MKTLFYLILFSGLFIRCNAPYHTVKNSEDSANMAAQDTVRIANDAIEYEIIIIEPGFNIWLESRAKPEGYYSQPYLEGRNRLYVMEWNSRVLQPHRFNPKLYEMQIDYDSGVDYGYEVNYKLYNYFIYFQLTYKQQLSGFVPRI